MPGKSLFFRGIVAFGLTALAVGPAPAAQMAGVTSAIQLDAPAIEDAYRYSLHVDSPQRVHLGEPISFDCTVGCRSRNEKAVIRLRVFPDKATEPLFEGAQPLELQPGGDVRTRFVWQPTELADGPYRVVMDLQVPEEPDTARAEWLIHVRSRDHVNAEYARLTDEVTQLGTHFRSLNATGPAVPYARMRAVIVQDALLAANERLTAGEWMDAGALLEYVNRLVVAAKARLTFGEGTAGEVPNLDLSRSEFAIQDGLFFSQGRPVFLFGVLGWGDAVNDLPKLHDLGMRALALPVGPDVSMASVQAAEAAASANDISLTLLAVPAGRSTLPGSAAWMLGDGTIVDELNGGGDAWLSQLSSVVKGSAAVNSISVLHKPAFAFGGEAVRLSFVDYLHQLYPNRDAINRVWRARLKLFDDASLTDDYPRPAYKYDVRTFQMGLATSAVSGLTGTVRAQAPGRFTQVTAPASAFVEGSADNGHNVEWLEKVVDVNGLATSVPTTETRYLLDHPRNTIEISLLDSLSPDKPVYSGEMHLFPAVLPEGVSGEPYGRAALWDAVVSGLDGGAVWAWADDTSLPAGVPGIKNHLDRLGGYATGVLDVNRLAPVVASLQRAPATIGILWSSASRIFDGGRPYLASAMRAYEGLTFSGQKLRFISEEQCVRDGLAGIQVLVIPQMPAISNAAFEVIDQFIQDGGHAIRTGTMVPYDAHGQSREDVINYTVNTLLVRGADDPVSYLHACETAYANGALTQIPRAVNEFGYLLEGVKSRYVSTGTAEYLYVMNIRPDAVRCYLPTGHSGGQDLVSGTRETFPLTLEPLRPVLIALDSMDDSVHVATVESVGAVRSTDVR